MGNREMLEEPGDEELAELREIDELPPADPDCWACTRRSGSPEGGKAPLCRFHYAKLRLKFPATLTKGARDAG